MTNRSRRTAPKRAQNTSPKWGRIILASGLIFAGVAAVQAHEIDEDDGNKITRSYDLSGFDEIRVSGVYDVEIRTGDAFSIRLEGRDKEMKYARVEVNGDRLELGQKKKKWNWGNRKSIDAYVTLPRLNALGVSGVADVDAEDIKAETFKLRVSGVADVNISGECGFIEASISGVSDVDAKAFKCQDGDVNMSGVGDLQIYTSESIDASVSGVGDVFVYGRPSKVEKSVSKYTASLEVVGASKEDVDED